MRKTLLQIICIIMISCGLLTSHGTAMGSDNIPGNATENPLKGKVLDKAELPVMGAVLVPNSDGEIVWAFDPVTGDLIEPYFFPGDSENLSTPLYVTWNHDGSSFLVADQVEGVVQQFNASGTFEQTFAPQGGYDSDIMSNIRSIVVKDNGELLVCVASGANANAIARFDTNGNFLGNLIDNNAGGMDRPFGLLYREDFDDYLVAANGSSGIHRYDSNGEFIEMFVTNISFPQQISRAKNGNILVASSTTPVGVLEYDNNGQLVDQYDVVGGVRGVHELNNGNLLVSTASGVYVITRLNQMLEQKAYGNARMISYVRPMDIEYFPLTLNTNPEGAGKIIDETGNFGEYPAGHMLTLTAVPDVYHGFVNWTDKNGQIIGTQTTINYQMPAEEMTLTANLYALPLNEITFSVVENSAEALPVEGAEILFDEFDPLVTDENGQVSFDFPEGNFVGHIVKNGYVTSEVSFEVSGNDFVIEVRLSDNIIVPHNLSVTTEGLEHGQALMSWIDPSLYKEFRHDDGQRENTLGFQNNSLKSVMGSAYRHNAVVRQIKWNIDKEQGPDMVKIWVLGLDEEGMPNRDDVLYVAENVPVNDDWSTLKLDEPIVAPNGLFIGFSANAFLHLSTDDGEGEPWNFKPETHFGVFDITLPGSPFVPLENWGHRVNFIIRAIGEDYGELQYDGDSKTGKIDELPAVTIHPAKPLSLPESELSGLNTRSFLGVNIYVDDMENPVATNVTDNEYLITNLPVGQHMAGVRSVYSTGESIISMVGFEIILNEPPVFDLPYYEDFEVYSGQQDFLESSFWTVIDANDDGYSWYHLYDSWDQNHVMASPSFIQEEETSVSPHDYLVTPGIRIPDPEDEESFIELDYYVAASSHEAYAENYYVLVSVTGNEAEDFSQADTVFQETLTEAESTWNFAKRSINLDQYRGQDIFIAFVHSASRADNQLLIREVGVEVKIPAELFAVTFNVDMSEAVDFDPAENQVYISGGFPDDMNWVEPGTDSDFMMQRVDQSLVYSIVLELQAGEYSYKYFSDAYGSGFEGAEWNDDYDDRLISVDSETSADDVWAEFAGGVDVPSLEQNELLVFPNPARNLVNISGEELIHEITLYNSSGQIIYKAEPGSNQHVIDVAGFDAGLVIIQVVSSEGITVRKIQLIK